MIVSATGKPATTTNPDTVVSPARPRSSNGISIRNWLQYLSNACFVGLIFFYMVVLPKELRETGTVDKKFRKLISTGLILSIPYYSAKPAITGDD